ncbi:CHAT domain-containing protein [Corallococcus llansteffanensis]|uniref:CHAT domain-containing protein n=1 Tax=Corallococcus llansteffanensis TaxID=2316731 RepID=A0A3A8PIC0_9BACT|nr:CHAT domain-containing protein [Corallococcus llansteffanensis]RKH54371.1 CHAT domain-containing protein [Corallococcus llansteffanensis]
MRPLREGRSHRFEEHPLLVVARALSQFVDGHPQFQVKRTLGDTAHLAQEAIEVLFADGGGITPEEIAVWLQWNMSMRPFVAPPSQGVTGVEVMTHLAVLALKKLLEMRRVAPESSALLCMALNSMDDELFKQLRERYSVRPAILGELVRCFDKMPGRVRHADLTARLKWGLAAKELDKEGLFAVALEVLSTLPAAIAARIQETSDGNGPGRCPNGHTVSPQLEAGRVITGLGLGGLRQGYRSLPLLRAEALFELGRVLASIRLGISERNLAEAHQRFDEASVAFMAAGDPATAAMAAIAATDCLARRLPLVLDHEPLFALRQRLLAYGTAAHQQVLGSGLPAVQARELGQLAKAAHAPVLAYKGVEDLAHVMASEVPSPEVIHSLERRAQDSFQGATAHFQALREASPHDPWKALQFGTAASLLQTTFWITLRGVLFMRFDKAQQALLRERFEELLRQHTPPGSIEAFLQAISSAAAALDNPSHGAHSTWILGLRTHPLASHARLFESISALLCLLIELGQLLTPAQGVLIAEALEQAGIPSLELAIVFAFKAAELKALRASLKPGQPAGDWVRYLRLRIHTLESALNTVMRTDSERAQLSGWLMELVTLFRTFHDDFRTLPPGEALWLLERGGASTFRANSLWLGRGECGVPPRYSTRSWSDVEQSIQAPLEAEDAPHSPLRHWNEFLMAHATLAQYGRLKMSIEAGKLDPRVQAVFSQLLEDSALSRMAFGRGTPPEHIEELTGVPPEHWEQRDGVTLVRIPLDSYEQVCDQVDRARRRIAWAFSALRSDGEVPDGDPVPDVDPTALQALFKRRPGLGVLVPGPWPEVRTPLSLFVCREGAPTRLESEVLTESAGREHAVSVLMEVREAIRQDRARPSNASFQQLGAAMDTLREALAPWSRHFAALLAREGISELLILLRGLDFALVPWEDLEADEQGGRLGDRVLVGSLYSLAQLPTRPASSREGTVQLHGAGSSAHVMELGASGMRALASVGVARPPLSGTEACDARMLRNQLRTAARLRLFLHGFHHSLRPEADRITLVDGENLGERVDLKPEDIHALAIAGMDCVELWACEGGAYGRHLMEHGVAEEPEDLTVAFLLAGARRVISSRWHVPTLPSALLMERFALLLSAQGNEPEALARARVELRTAFSQRGFIEQRLMEWAASRQNMNAAGISQELERAFSEALLSLRSSWYTQLGLSPGAIQGTSGASLERMIRFVPPRSQQTPSAPEDSGPSLAQRIQDMLKPFRSSICWAGWRLTLRTLEDWRA